MTDLSLELYATLAGDRAEARLTRLREWLNTHQDQVVISVCLLLGSGWQPMASTC